MLAAVLRLGFVAKFISAPVLTGFKAGIGLVIVLDQVPKLLGVHIVKQGFFIIGRKRGADVLRPRSPENPDDATFHGLLILRPEGRLFFVNAQGVVEQIGRLVTEYKPWVVVLDLSRVPDLECSALQMLMKEEKRASEHGIVVWLVGLNPGVVQVVRNAGLVQLLGAAACVLLIRTFPARTGADD